MFICCLFVGLIVYREKVVSFYKNLKKKKKEEVKKTPDNNEDDGQTQLVDHADLQEKVELLVNKHDIVSEPPEMIKELTQDKSMISNCCTMTR